LIQKKLPIVRNRKKNKGIISVFLSLKGEKMTRSFKHWTMRYLWNRVIEKSYRRSHPDVPWLAPAAVEFLEGYLKPEDRLLEFGSGRSTLWFAKRIAHITSVEHNPEWFAIVTTMLNQQSIENVTYSLHQKETHNSSGAQSGYVNVTTSLAKESLDLILVDGIYRSQCVLKSLPLIRPGGILVIDNVNRYLPSKSIAPNSRSFNQGPIDEEWKQALGLLTTWRFFWSSNGVSDTAFYFKPAK
jgi:predicted O-methyltransferase YrrM